MSVAISRWKISLLVNWIRWIVFGSWFVDIHNWHSGSIMQLNEKAWSPSHHWPNSLLVTVLNLVISSVSVCISPIDILLSDTSCLLWRLPRTLTKKHFNRLPLDFSLNRLTPFPLDDSIALPDYLCDVIVRINFCNVRFLVRLKPWTFLIHFYLKLLSLFLYFWDLDLSYILRSLFFTFLVVP